MVVAALVAIAALAIGLKLAFPLPDRAISAEIALKPEQGDLASAIAGYTSGHAGLSGIHLVPVGIDAFAARIAMVRAAQRSIDAQYYIWENDVSGHMMLEELIGAADRGVRVRLLLDDNPTAGLDSTWRAVAAHRNIEVRLFNPLSIRKVRPANYLFDFPRLNRRMHNKSLTVDGAVTVVGGRNIGDAYFGAGTEGLFIDLDAVVIGAAVPDVSQVFQRYWDSPSAYPAGQILGKSSTQDQAHFAASGKDGSQLAAAYRAAVGQQVAALDFAHSSPDLTWAQATVLSDDPAKALNKAARSGLLASRLEPLIKGARQRFDLVSGYFVPGDFGKDLLTGLARKGVQARVVTNSIQVTDVPIVNAGYAPYREPLLRAGVRLFEARPLSEHPAKDRVKLGGTSFSGGGESVHAKSFAIDNRLLFVGSFNFDPRSALLNCEMGMVIESPELARAFNSALDQRLPDSTHALKLRDDKLVWDDGQQAYTTEPGTRWWQRGIIKVLSWLPVEWAL